jgi:creatinine amidohydrolase
MTPAEPARWSDRSWPDLRELLSDRARGHQVGLVPVGAIEQHGPHLPVGTDTIVATALCDRVAAVAGCLTLPAIPLGVSYGHGTVLPGTLSLSPELLVATVHQYARWAALSGLDRLLFVNAHFGNVGSLSVATDHIRLSAPQLRVGLIHWWSATPDVLAAVTEDGADIHANRAETSVMLALAPDLVHLERMAQGDDPDRTGELVFRYTAPALTTNGVTGRPSLASANHGSEIVASVVTAIVDRVDRGRTEEPPLGEPPAPRFPF